MHTGFTTSTHFRSARLLAAAGFFMGTSGAFGQGLYNQSDIFINGIAVHVDGEIDNAGNLENAGILSLTGDWESKGSYTGPGMLEISGNAAQKVSHHGQDVHSVLIDGWGTKYVRGTINISQSLHLKQGIVHIAHGDVLHLKQNAVINGGHDASFVDGAITATGTGYKFFPVGKNGTYAPIEFLNVKGDLATYSVEAFEDAPAVSVENVIVRRALYWHRRDVVGNFGGSAVAIGFDRSTYQDPKNIMLINGTDWDDPFMALTDIQHSTETHKISTTRDIVAPLLLLGEISERWNESDFYFSTALSPHAAHAENRTVRIFGDRMSEENFHFQVFNRWGELVYESISREAMATNGWDGRTHDGTELRSGTYPYRLTGADKMGTKLEKKGVITIIH